MLLAITVVVWLIAPWTMSRFKVSLLPLLERPHAIRVDTEADLMAVLSTLAGGFGLLAVFPLLFLLLVGLISAVAQTGWMFTPSKLMPDLSKLNPMSGFGRLFSARAAVELAKNVAKLTVVGAITYMLLKPSMRDLESLIGMDLVGILSYMHHTLIHVLIGVVMAVLVIGAVDWLYQRFSFMRKMRMTKQEVKDEHKQTEGDPMIKSRIRSLRQQRARQRMMQAVPKADVVVTNPTHYACALKYDSETMNAPTLVAKGQNLVALRIRELAEENDVPVVENPPLARALFATVEIDAQIPPEHYKAVAEVISYVMRLKGKFGR
jgi:flagellar biosynthetic protein FlhB